MASVVSELADDERRLLIGGLHQWSGPARPTTPLAEALGFVDVTDLYAQCARWSELLRQGADLPSRDLIRAVVATECVFVSDVFGAGVEWETVTGLSDDETIRILRRLQRKVVGLRSLLDDNPRS